MLVEKFYADRCLIFDYENFLFCSFSDGLLFLHIYHFGQCVFQGNKGDPGKAGLPGFSGKPVSNIIIFHTIFLRLDEYSKNGMHIYDTF